MKGSRIALVGAATTLIAVGFVAGRWTASFAGTGAPRSTPIGYQSPDTPRAATERVRALTGDAIAREGGSNGGAAAWNLRWSQLRSQSASGAREHEMLALLGEKAAVDPLGALKLANLEKNVRFKHLLINAALGGWASEDPAAAVEWAAANVADAERGAAIKAIVENGMGHPDETIAAINELCVLDPLVAADYGRVLIEALGRNDDFSRAVQFASMSSGDNRNYWFSSAFFAWAQYRPQEAVAALAQVTDSGASNEALHGLVYGWASNDPAGLLEFAVRLPDGNVRKTALNEALQHWVTNDPEGASTWMATHGPSADVDSGAVKLATNPDFVAKEPDAALQWAVSIVDPEQRTFALTDVIQQWWSHNPTDARRYLEASTDLLPETRSRLLRELQTVAAAPSRN